MKKEIELEYMHLCDYASPALGAKVNLMGIFTVFTLTKIPTFFIVSRIQVKEKGVYEISLEIKSKKGDRVVYVDPQPIKTPENNQVLNFNIIRQIHHLDFKEPGMYIITLLVNGLPVGYKEVEVKNPN